MWKFAVVAFVVAGVSAQGTLGKRLKSDEVGLCDTDAVQSFSVAWNSAFAVNCQPDHWNSTLTFIINVEANSTSGVVIDIRSGILPDKDSFTVTDNSQKGIVLFDHYGASKEILLTGSLNVTIVIKRDEKPKGFAFKVRSLCHFDNESLKFPTLPKVKPALNSSLCTASITVPHAISFSGFKLSKDSSMMIDGMPSGFQKNFTTASPPSNVILVDKATITLTIDLTTSDQNLNVDFTKYDGSELCGGPAMILATDSPVVIQPKPKPWMPISCFWLVSAPEKEEFLTAQFGKETLKLGTSVFSGLDGGNFSSPVVMTLDSMYRTADLVMTSGHMMLVTFVSNTFNESEASPLITISKAKRGGKYHTKGSLDLSGSGKSLFFVDTDPGSIIVLNFPLPNDKGSIEIFSDFSTDSPQIAKFEKNCFDIYSVTNKVLIVATDVSNYTLSFSSISGDSNCFATFINPSQGKISVNNKTACPPGCTWLIPPTNADLDVISTLFMDGATSAKVMTYAGDVAYDLDSQSKPFSFSAHNSHGMRINFDCQKGAFAMSYIKVKEDDFVAELEQSQNITITSPFYPAAYPIDGTQNYTVSSKSKSTKAIYLGFQVFDVPSPSSFMIGNTAFSGSSSFPDVIIPESKFSASFVSQRKGVESPNPGFGFLASVVALECGGSHTDVTTNATTNDFPKNVPIDTKCLWIVKLPKPSDANTGLSLNITLNLGNITDPKLKNLTSISSALQVFDGDSVFRSPLKTNLTNGEMFQARTNTLIVSYVPSLANLSAPLSISVAEVKCSLEEQNMCRNSQTCILPSWRCDGIVQCEGDASDEINCNGPRPTPNPKPSPTPSSGYKTAFWICVPLFFLFGILSTIYGPVVATKIREYRYQQFHNLPDA